MTYIFELTIDNEFKKHEFYSSSEVALESAMMDIFDTIEDGEWLSKPHLDTPISDTIKVWLVCVLGLDGVHDIRRILIRKSHVIDKLGL